MAVILSLLGIVLAAAGVAAVGFGIPINEFTLGTTLVLAGTTALAGGLILIGLAAVVAELGRVTAALQTRVVARPTSRPAEAAERVAPPAPSIVAAPAPSIVASPAPVIAASARPAEAEVPPRLRHEAPLRDVRPSEAAAVPVPSAVDVSSTAIERLRSSIPRTERPKGPSPSLVTEHGRRPPVSQRGRAPARATIPAFGRSGRTVRAEGCRGRSRGWRGCRRLEGVPTGFSVSFEAGAGHDPSGEFRCVLARRAPGREKFAAGVGFGRGRRSSPIGGRVRVRSRCPAGAPDDARARSNGYSEVGCRRGHGLHALRRRIDRGGASKRTGAVRLHRRVARAHRKQFITGRHALVAGHGPSRPALIAPRRRHFSVVTPGAKLSATPFMQ